MQQLRLRHDWHALEIFDVAVGDEAVEVAQADGVFRKDKDVPRTAIHDLAAAAKRHHRGIDGLKGVDVLLLQHGVKPRQHVAAGDGVIRCAVVIEVRQTQRVRHDVELVFSEVGHQILRQNERIDRRRLERKTEPLARRSHKADVKVGVVGATGMVGQRFITLLENHPWFDLVCLAASSRSAGKKYSEAAAKKWCMDSEMPEKVKDMTVLDAEADIDKITSMVDFVFCAVDMKKDEIKKLEEAYAKHECPVVSNNSANRFTPDVPMVVPELNAEHINIIPAQRKRLGTKRGFIAVKSNCSLQSYVPALFPLHEKFGVKDVLVCTYQAISGAGKTFETWPDMVDNVIPYIGGEEEKSEKEPLKLWGKIEGDEIVCADKPNFTAQCIRVPVSNGHLGAVFVNFENKPSKEEMIDIWNKFKGRAQELELPSAPKQFLNYFTEDDRPQIKSERMLENGMAISIGRLREDTQYQYKFVCLSHNTLRGAAGGGVLLAELLCAEGYMD